MNDGVVVNVKRTPVFRCILMFRLWEMEKWNVWMWNGSKQMSIINEIAIRTIASNQRMDQHLCTFPFFSFSVVWKRCKRHRTINEFGSLCSSRVCVLVRAHASMQNEYIRWLCAYYWLLSRMFSFSGEKTSTFSHSLNALRNISLSLFHHIFSL